MCSVRKGALAPGVRFLFRNALSAAVRALSKIVDRNAALKPQRYVLILRSTFSYRRYPFLQFSATISGARIYLAMAEAGEDFSTWTWAMAGNNPVQNHGPIPAKTPISEEISAALRKRGFKFVGPVIVYAWMQACGMVNDHTPNCF